MLKSRLSSPPLKRKNEDMIYCRKCKKLLWVPRIDGEYSGSIDSSLFYCDNKKCEFYGIVVVTGVKNKE